MARLIERAFNPAEPVVARRFFVAAGRHYNPGDHFDWKRLAVSQRRVKQLFDNGKLMHASTPKPSFAETLSAVGPVVTPAPTIEQELEDQAILSAPAEPAAPQDELDGLNMKELREIAAAEGAPTRLRREDQREAIREHRLAGKDG